MGSEQAVDVVDIVEGVVEIELQVRAFAEHLLHGLCELISHSLRLLLDVVNDSLPFFGREYAEICLGDAEVGVTLTALTDTITPPRAAVWRRKISLSSF